MLPISLLTRTSTPPSLTESKARSTKLNVKVILYYFFLIFRKMQMFYIQMYALQYFFVFFDTWISFKIVNITIVLTNSFYTKGVLSWLPWYMSAIGDFSQHFVSLNYLPWYPKIGTNQNVMFRFTREFPVCHL